MSRPFRRRNPLAVYEAVQKLSDLGIGTRATGRLLHMSPSHVSYYRRSLGIVTPPDADIFERLPDDVRRAVIAAREEVT